VIPGWLQRQRAEQGQRAATLRLCPRCKAPVIVGLDADRAAINATCDPTPISELGEAYALVQGRATYCFADDQGRKILWHRYHWNIKAERQWPVLAAHRCNQPMTPFAAPLTATTPRKAAAHDDAPPF
jgi:hypothetical protein